MRILIVGNFQPDEQQSMQRYADWLENVLQRRGLEVTLVKPRPFFASLTQSPFLVKYLGYLDKFLLFPFRLRQLAKTHDLVHIADHSNAMYLGMIGDAPSLITCHDVLAIRAARGEFFQVSVGWTGRILQRWILASLRSARYVICVSAKTAMDLRALTGDAGAQVRVIHNALNWKYRPGATLPDSLIARLKLKRDRPYLLHVGGNQWYKNRECVLRIFADLSTAGGGTDISLVLAGKPWTDEMRTLIHENQLDERVIEAVGITNEEMQALYANALALLFPSLQEGFGWPILEAQSCGCPVITTCRSPMSDVAGEAAILIDPSDPKPAALAIIEGLKRREQLRTAGFINIRRFEEGGIVDKYCAFYEAILGSECKAAQM